VNNLPQKEGGGEHCEEQAKWEPDSKEDGALHLHAPYLQVEAHPINYKSLIHEP